MVWARILTSDTDLPIPYKLEHAVVHDCLLARNNGCRNEFFGGYSAIFLRKIVCRHILGEMIVFLSERPWMAAHPEINYNKLQPMRGFLAMMAVAANGDVVMIPDRQQC